MSLQKRCQWQDERIEEQAKEIAKQAKEIASLKSELEVERRSLVATRKRHYFAGQEDAFRLVTMVNCLFPLHLDRLKVFRCSC